MTKGVKQVRYYKIAPLYFIRCDENGVIKLTNEKKPKVKTSTKAGGIYLTNKGRYKVIAPIQQAAIKMTKKLLKFTNRKIDIQAKINNAERVISEGMEFYMLKFVGKKRTLYRVKVNKLVKMEFGDKLLKKIKEKNRILASKNKKISREHYYTFKVTIYKRIFNDEDNKFEWEKTESIKMKKKKKEKDDEFIEERVEVKKDGKKRKLNPKYTEEEMKELKQLKQELKQGLML